MSETAYTPPFTWLFKFKTHLPSINGLCQRGSVPNDRLQKWLEESAVADAAARIETYQSKAVPPVRPEVFAEIFGTRARFPGNL